MSYKEMESTIIYLVQLLKRQEVWEIGERSLQKYFDFALNQLNDDERIIFEHEFLLTCQKDWWLEYYSRSSFYRLKKSAMTSFIRCLKS